jgi:hypothetical protein
MVMEELKNDQSEKPDNQSTSSLNEAKMKVIANNALSLYEHTIKYSTFGRLDDWIRTVRLNRKMERLHKKYFHDLRSADSQDKRNEISRTYNDELVDIVKALDIFVTIPLLQKAGRLGIDIPPDWTIDSNSDSEVYKLFRQGFIPYLQLTPAGKSKLREALTQKNREKWEWYSKVIIPFISALTGLAGTVIAIIALLRK